MELKLLKRISNLFYIKKNHSDLLKIDREIGKGSNCENLKLISRYSDTTSKPKLKIGTQSIVSAEMVFENNRGSISVGDRSFIGGGLIICVNEIGIGDDVLISWGCTIMDNDAHSLNWEYRKSDVADWKKGMEKNKIGFYKDWSNVKSSPICIKNKSWIGFNSTILKGVTIGEGAVVGAGSVVREDVPDHCLVIGNPARVIKKLK